MDSITPLTQSVREHMRRRGYDVTRLAAELNMVRTTLSARLTSSRPLSMNDPADLELAKRIAETMGVTFDTIVETAHDLSTAGRTHDIDIITVLLDTLENGQASADSKQAARRAILRMLGTEPNK
jgi:hypothetical protein